MGRDRPEALVRGLAATSVPDLFYHQCGMQANTGFFVTEGFLDDRHGADCTGKSETFYGANAHFQGPILQRLREARSRRGGHRRSQVPRQRLCAPRGSCPSALYAGSESPASRLPGRVLGRPSHGSLVTCHSTSSARRKCPDLALPVARQGCVIAVSRQTTTIAVHCSWRGDSNMVACLD